MNGSFSIKDRVAVISGAAGVLGGSLARHFAQQGARVAALVHRDQQVEPTLESLKSFGGEVLCFACNVFDSDELEKIAEEIVSSWGRVDILVNVAGGNVPDATVMPDQNFWDMPTEAWDKVMALNLSGTVFPCRVFSKYFAGQKSGCILNISSMAAYDALTRVPGYGAAKEGVSNFTRWLAAEMAIKYGDGIRVNALAPGFFIGRQNRAALLNEDGSLTERSHKVINKTPMRRFGDITELNGHKYGYARRGQELRLMYNDFCSRHLGPFEKSSSTVTLGRCLTELMEELFQGRKYAGPGGRKALTVYKQDLPVTTQDDYDADTSNAPSPYLVVQMDGGSIPDDKSPQEVDFSLVICCYDDQGKREGYQDVSNIKETIIQRICSAPYFGGAFTILKPYAWAIQKDDTDPYYYGAITFTCTAPALTQDSVLEELL